MRRIWGIILAAAVLVAAGACAATSDAPSDTAVVERVVDGDTVIVRASGERIRVRLIGVDTPETVKPGAPVECYGPEASAYVHQVLAEGEEVRLEYDLDRLDRYERTLAYVFRERDDLFVNRELVGRGFAVVLTIRPNVAHLGEFAAAERAARAARRGLWGACSRAP
ncbi:MAG: thermonuclease family protein [Actinomycetota bacterium]